MAARAEAEGARVYVPELARRERERDRAKPESLDPQSEAAVSDWIRQRNYEERAQCERAARGTESEPELTERFDWKWVDKWITARLQQEREYFNAALAEHARDTIEM